MQVVLCYIEYQGKILLLQRLNPPYNGMLALPGGKVERNEKPVEAACRETLEETGLIALDAEICGYGCETVLSSESKEVLFAYEMVLVRLQVESLPLVASAEGKLVWCSKEKFFNDSRVVPTDIDLVNSFIINDDNSYLHYTVEYVEDTTYNIVKRVCEIL